ncbi:MAG: hypothetical protein ACI9EW_002256, partial [Cellvibrionaceae bacterium]
MAACAIGKSSYFYDKLRLLIFCFKPAQSVLNFSFFWKVLRIIETLTRVNTMKFDWDIDEDAEADFLKRELEEKQPRKIRWQLFLFVFVFVSAITAASWWRITQYDGETQQFLQAAVDLQTNAVSDRDGDLYFTNYSSLPSSTYLQMHPYQIEFWMSSPEVVDFELFEDEIWVQAEWVSAENEQLYRTVFFTDVDSSIRLSVGSKAYWQTYYAAELSHGELVISERDRPYESAFQARINPILEAYCRSSDLLDECASISISIGPFAFTPVDEFEFTSPRLYGLTAEGHIPESYWSYFDSHLQDLLLDTTIRFGIPSTLETKFPALVAQFEAADFGRNIKVELVSYDPGIVDYVEFIKSVDGLFLEPSLDVVMSGAIQPVDDLAEGKHLDFYAQHWASAWWQDHMWFLPIDGEMFFVSYDGSYAAHANDPQEQYPDWNWEEFSHVMDVYSQQEGLDWGVVAPNASILLSKAYSSDNRCPNESRPIYCSIELSTAAVEDALNFYSENSHQISIPPAGTVMDQINYFMTQASVSNGNAGMWVSRAQFFEHDRAARNSVMIAFPQSDHSPSISPLIVRGGAISSFSDSPVSTWTFIDWLSRQHITLAERTIPARPRTTAEIGFWDNLPSDIKVVMQEEFENSRPVRLGDAEHFRPEILSAVADGSQNPSMAARVG